MFLKPVNFTATNESKRKKIQIKLSKEFIKVFEFILEFIEGFSNVFYCLRITTFRFRSLENHFGKCKFDNNSLTSLYNFKRSFCNVDWTIVLFLVEILKYTVILGLCKCEFIRNSKGNLHLQKICVSFSTFLRTTGWEPFVQYYIGRVNPRGEIFELKQKVLWKLNSS